MVDTQKEPSEAPDIGILVSFKCTVPKLIIMRGILKKRSLTLKLPMVGTKKGYSNPPDIRILERFISCALSKLIIAKWILSAHLPYKVSHGRYQNGAFGSSRYRNFRKLQMYLFRNQSLRSGYLDKRLLTL